MESFLDYLENNVFFYLFIERKKIKALLISKRITSDQTEKKL